MKKIEEFYVVGISIRTTNENQQSAKDIPSLWQKFFSDKIADQVPNKINNELYCLYTDYESDFTKPYTTILGVAVKNLDFIPPSLVGLKIPSANYDQTSIQGDLHQGIVINEWNKIWSSGMKRAYSIDFECYSFGQAAEDTQVNIFISI